MRQNFEIGNVSLDTDSNSSTTKMDRIDSLIMV